MQKSRYQVSSVSCWSLRKSLDWEVGMGRKKHVSLYPTPLQTRFSETLEDYDLDFFRGLRSEYWCSRMATHGCKDPSVMLWLEAEYAAFQKGGTPNKVGDHQWMFPPLVLFFFL